jgi:hypothetical protein
MNPRPDRDAIDELIDSIIADTLSGEPRVTGESIRKAATRKRSWLPVWAGLAAALVIGLAIGRRSNEEVRRVETAAVSPQPTTTASPSVSPELAQEPLILAPGPAGFARVRVPRNTEPYEGLPRLVIAPIEPLKSLPTGRLESEGIQILGLDTTPLATPALTENSGIQN